MSHGMQLLLIEETSVPAGHTRYKKMNMFKQDYKKLSHMPYFQAG